ncbi:MAG: NADH:ubiquinone reductase (Na(+)-transporting) subunit F [Chthoniobacterales bacterium]
MPAVQQVSLSDYSLVGENTKRAIEQGLAEADWYTSPVPRTEMRKLLERRDGPALRDTIIWFALILISGYCGYLLWPSWWAIIPFAIYGMLYASSSDSRWHEFGHGTAFKTDWLNNALYEISSFMVLRESTPWRWSHTRHHSDTIIVGRDPEIAVPRPPDLKALFLGFFNITAFPKYAQHIALHSFGKLTSEEKTYIPESEHGKVFLHARIYLLIYAGVIGLSLYTGSILPLLFIGLPNVYGAWMIPIYGFTQHAGLAENVLDHRLNCRTVHMNFVNRFLYLNMNYHLEHHMFPLVPYHALPKLHKLIKDDLPTPYRGILDAYREIIPAVLKQIKDPGYYVKRKLPTPTNLSREQHAAQIFTTDGNSVEGWIAVCSEDALGVADIVRFDHEGRTYAIYRTGDNALYATDGICTHGNTHLADGLLKGKLIECPKHNGRFDVTDGSPQRRPVCVALQTYKVRAENGKILLNIKTAARAEATPTTHSFRVVSNDNVATYIKELVLEPEDGATLLKYRAGDYLQLNIPAYGEIAFRDMDIQEPYAKIWKLQHVFDLKAENRTVVRRNYSLATNPEKDNQLRFNVRIATPPRGQDCSAGAGSAYVFNLKPGDVVTAIGPFGEFHIKETENEMVYFGGGAGMAPLRSHLSHLFENLKTNRKVSYWYGARSLQELFYHDYFRELEKQFPNFHFHVALSEPEPEDQWASYSGFIHDVLRDNYLNKHENLAGVEFYLCGPPPMIKAGTEMLKDLNVSPAQISYDEFS